MKRYIIRRLLQAIFVIFGVSAVVFFVLNLSGDPVLLLLPSSAPMEEVEQFREAMGYNDPVYIQYLRFIKNAIRGDFGNSLSYDRSALDLVLECFPATLELAVGGVLLSVIIGIPLGILAAVRRDTFIDFIARIFAVVGQAIPSFWMGLILILLFSLKLGWLPTSGRGSWQQLVMPVLTIGLFSMAAITRQSRSSMLEVLNTDYIRTARAKGAKELIVLFYHAFRNAMLPVSTMVGLEIGHLLGGSVITETVFGWPGIGKLAVDAIYARDYPLVQAVVIISATVFVLVNLLVDMSYSLIDPRIKLSSK